LAGTALLMLYESSLPASRKGGDLFLDSLFQSITARTAGFNTVDIAKMSETGKSIMILLMAIGG
jgi:trk system potassium uptake protein TrkH